MPYTRSSGSSKAAEVEACDGVMPPTWDDIINGIKECILLHFLTDNSNELAATFILMFHSSITDP